MHTLNRRFAVLPVMVKNRRPMAALLVSVTIGLLPVDVGGDTGLSDRQKKTIVYQMYADGKKDFPKVKDLSPQQVMDLMKKGDLVLVDTRKPAEMQVSMLPGAITKREYLLEPGRYKNVTVVTYCTISYRSGVFARDMAKQGFAVYNLMGGILAWTLEGGSIYDPEGKPTREIHVFGKRWNYAPDGYRTVKFSLWEQLF